MEVTTKIKLKPYLREFLIAKFGEEPIRFPENSDLLALIHVLRIKPPKRDIVQDDVNTEIVIPYQRLGRDPRTYNYLGKRAQMELQKRVHTLFCITLNDYVAHKVHVERFEWQAAIELFAEEYNIESITTDGLKQKNYRDRNGKRFKRENRFKHLN